MRLRPSCVGLLVLTLAGCGTTHSTYKFQAPTRLPAALGSDLAVHELPDPSDSEEVSLHAILAYAHKHSPLLALSEAQLLRGEAAIAGVGPVLPSNPSVSMSAGPRIGRDGVGLDVSLGLQQQIDISGGRGFRREAAERFADVKHLELAEARWLVHQRVHALFHQTLVARKRTFAAAELLAFSESLVSIAQRRLKAGDISPLGVRVAEGELAEAAQEKVSADGEYRSMQLSLAVVSGWPTAHLPVPAGQLDEPRKAPAVDELVALSRISNPGLQTRLAETRLAEARVLVAQRKAWPKPTIGLQYSRESDPAGGLGGSSEADVLLFGVGIALPLWQKNTARRAEAKAEVMIARARHSGEEQSLAARVHLAANQVDVGAERIAAYGKTILPTFEQNMSMLRRAFELGEIEILDVSVAQRRFLEIQQSVLRAYQEYYEAVAILEQLVGAEIWQDESHDSGDHL